MALPNGPMEIVFSFDTTGSMYDFLEEVRGRVSDMIQRLQADIPGIKMAIFAHGDYCDQASKYVTKHIDFTDDAAKLVDFVNNVENTWGGGDGGECYELVLHEVRTKLSWSPGSQRALVLIGDDIAHVPSFRQNKQKLDWKKEADSLASIGVRIYSVQCDTYKAADAFYSGLAKRTDGKHLQLKDFKNIFDFLMTICYRENGDDLFHNYEKEVRARGGGMHKDLDKLFCDLRSKAPTASIGGIPSTVGASNPTATLKKLTKPTALKKRASLTKRPVQKKKTVPRKTLINGKTLTKATSRAGGSSSTKRQVPIKSAFADRYLPKLRRENVPESNFMLREVPWSAWKLVISPKENIKLGVKHLRPGNGFGYKTKSIFDGKTQVPALYEVAVQTKHRARRHVVYNKICRLGFSDKANWEKHLLGRSDIQDQIEEILKKGCSVFIRRVVLKRPKINSVVRKNLRRYDYAWKELKSERVGHRKVTKGSIEISNEMEM